MQVTFGTHTINTDTLPVASVNALLSRGLSHYLGNEQASKVTAKIRTKISSDLSTPDKEVNQKDISTEQVKSFRETFPDTVQEWTDTAIANAIAALNDGTVGVRAIGEAKVSPKEAIVNSIASAEVIAQLASRDMVKKDAKKVKSDQAFVFNAATADERTVTFGALVAKKIELHRERLDGEAQKELDRRAREAAKVAAKVADQGMDDLLG